MKQDVRTQHCGWSDRDCRRWRQHELHILSNLNKQYQTLVLTVKTCFAHCWWWHTRLASQTRKKNEGGKSIDLSGCDFKYIRETIDTEIRKRKDQRNQRSRQLYHMLWNKRIKNTIVWIQKKIVENSVKMRGSGKNYRTSKIETQS